MGELNFDGALFMKNADGEFTKLCEVGNLPDLTESPNNVNTMSLFHIGEYAVEMTFSPLISFRRAVKYIVYGWRCRAPVRVRALNRARRLTTNRSATATERNEV